MKILELSTSIFALPPQGYSGTEQLVYLLACQFHKMGHQVTVAAPEGSTLPEGIELLPLALGETEEASFGRYRERLTEFDIIHDSTFGSWAYMDSIGVDPPLPIVKTFHTDPSVWETPPAVPHPCLVGLSRDHARRLMLHLSISAEYVYNGIDTTFYRPPKKTAKRNGRLLYIGRYTPEKGVLQTMQLAKRLRMPLDCYGDVTIVSDPGYVDRCRQEADGTIVRWYPGVSREKTVELYQTYRAFLNLPVWSEHFGLTVVEAQACGMPVVTLSHGSMPELVKHGETGYVCDDLAQVEEVLKNNCIKSIDSKACRTWAEEFTVERMGDRYLELFERVRRGELW